MRYGWRQRHSWRATADALWRRTDTISAPTFQPALDNRLRFSPPSGHKIRQGLTTRPHLRRTTRVLPLGAGAVKALPGVGVRRKQEDRTMPRFTGISHVELTVTDPERTAAWWSES